MFRLQNWKKYEHIIQNLQFPVSPKNIFSNHHKKAMTAVFRTVIRTLANYWKSKIETINKTLKCLKIQKKSSKFGYKFVFLTFLLNIINDFDTSVKFYFV
jgi:hypothetical protein